MVVSARRKFTIDEYHQLVDLGFFTENDRIELIRGEIIEMAPKRAPHSVCNSILFGELYRLIYDQANVRGQEPITLPSNSEPEPDLEYTSLAFNFLKVQGIQKAIKRSQIKMKRRLELCPVNYPPMNTKHF